jgi:hypothetical protein
MRAPADAPFEGLIYGRSWQPEDADILAAPTFETMRRLLQAKHDAAYAVYLDQTAGHAHLARYDPFAFLLHSNADRLFAMWQAGSGQAWRLEPGQVYGSERGELAASLVEPWTAGRPAPPWAAAEQRLPRSFAHPSIVAPPCYDSLPTSVTVDDGANPGGVIQFSDVHSGQTFARAAAFRVAGAGNVRFRVTRGPTGPYTIITPGAAVTVNHSPSLYQEARIWFGFTGGTPGTSAQEGAVTIRCDQTSEDFVFRLRGNSVAPPGLTIAPQSVRRILPPEPPTRGAAQRTAVTWTWSWKPA